MKISFFRFPLTICILAFVALVAFSLLAGCGSGTASIGQSKEQLGRALFHDTSLSQPAGQACASCHQDANAFADPRKDSPTSEGAVPGRFGKRQTPTINYMAYSPPFHFDPDSQDYVGGQFWDGRATDLKDQVHFPMLNAAEMNNASKADIVAKVQAGQFANTMRQVYGAHVFDDPNQAFDAIADAISTFEKSATFSPFTSKYDYYFNTFAKMDEKS